jgi:hypothetical protein
MTEEDRPPEEIWPFPEELEEWFDILKARRAADRA